MRGVNMDWLSQVLAALLLVLAGAALGYMLADDPCDPAAVADFLSECRRGEGDESCVELAREMFCGGAR